MTQTDNLSLPYILSSQAQKHITHNESLLALDAVVQLHVLSRSLTKNPGNPNPGDRYIVPSLARQKLKGDFTNNSGKIAAFQDGVFQFYTPKSGWLAYVSDEDKHIYFDGTSWQDLITGNNPGQTEKIGINTTADNTNRFAVSSLSSLFNHAGNGHQLKINKASSRDTASLLFQTELSSHAELGLIGDNQFRIQISNDGHDFNQILNTDTTTGFTAIGNIAPSANLTVAHQMEVVEPIRSSKLSTTVTSNKATLTSTSSRGTFEFNQNGKGYINFVINDHKVLALRNENITANRPLTLPNYSLANLPSPIASGQMIYVINARGGSCIAFSDGEFWRRTEDRSIVS